MERRNQNGIFRSVFVVAVAAVADDSSLGCSNKEKENNLSLSFPLERSARGDVKEGETSLIVASSEDREGAI